MDKIKEWAWGAFIFLAIFINSYKTEINDFLSSKDDEALAQDEVNGNQVASIVTHTVVSDEISEEEIKRNLAAAQKEVDDHFKLIITDGKNVFDANYNGTFQFTVQNRINKPIVAFEIGFKEIGLPNRVISVKRFKKVVNPNQSFSGSFSLNDIYSDNRRSAFFVTSLITSDGTRHDIHYNVFDWIGRYPTTYDRY